MKKGDLRRQAILEAGLKMASSVGLEAVTIGGLAKATGMSKSGLFAHFQSKENLQMEILAFAGQVFADHVVVPALAAPAGVVRIKTLVDNWVAWTERESIVRDLSKESTKICSISNCRGPPSYKAKSALR